VIKVSSAPSVRVRRVVAADWRILISAALGCPQMAQCYILIFLKVVYLVQKS